MIFDSDVAIWMLKRHPEALRLARAVLPGERNISIVSYLEILRGCRDGREATDLEELVNNWFTEIVPLTPGISDTALGLMKRFALARRPAVADVLIAATALERRETLITGNVKHFGFVPGLLVRAFRPSSARKES